MTPTTPTLSILVPAVDRRRTTTLPALLDELFRQAEEQSRRWGRRVEVLCLMDNRARSIGAKRQALLDAARGDYVAFVDDDDRVRPEYAQLILDAIESADAGAPFDVVGFMQECWLDGKGPYVVRFMGDALDMRPVNEEVRLGETVTRRMWHVCAWRRGLALESRFPDSNYGEDWAWAEPLQPRIGRWCSISCVLHEYRHSSATTEASA